MPNQRVSDLAQITATELALNDLLLVSDVNAFQSKKLTFEDLVNFLFPDDTFSGSLHGTASWAYNALTASYVISPTSSFAHSSSTTLNAATASYAIVAQNSSASISSSYALTASFALTSSVEFVFSSSFSNYTITASYLQYTPGGPDNGTASFALTASFFSGPTNLTTSYALFAGEVATADTASTSVSSSNADTASSAFTASYLQFDGVNPNGTASYAIFAGNIPNNQQDYGIFQAITQSITSSQLDLVSVLPTFGGFQSTEVEVNGTIDAPFTSSNLSTILGRVELFALNRQYGFSQSLDFTPVYIVLGGTATISGTLHYPFTLHGEAPLYGLYKLYVTASHGVFLDGHRTMRYKIASTSDQLTVSPAEPTIFNTYPVNSILSWSSSLHPGILYQGSASQVIFSGSADVTALVAPAGTVTVMNYAWTLTGCKSIVVDNNTGMTFLGGIPTNCVTMSAAFCSLTELPDMSTGSLSYANFQGNNIVANLSLPATMSYLNVAGNYNINLPTFLPDGMLVIIADRTGITTTPQTVPDSLITMSFNSCPNLNAWLSPSFPANLEYLDLSVSPISNIPTVIPSSLQYVNVANCQLSPVLIGNLATGLVSNGVSNGYFAFINNPNSGSAFNITANVNTLISRGWTVIS